MTGRLRAAALAIVLLAVALLAVALPGVGPLATSASAQTPPPSWMIGSGPLADIVAQADAAKKCGLGRDQLAAMMIAPTIPETGATSTRAASPMTLSRYDNQTGLYAFGSTTVYPRAFFHPGIGLWQFDSAGGWPLIAATAINTATAAQQAATLMANRWCTNPTLSYVWAPWYGCATTTICSDIYNAIFDGTTLNIGTDPTITGLGGMEARRCNVVFVGEVDCWFVDPSRAQGLKSWTTPNFGPSPITFPFYSYAINGREYRTWLKEDTGYGVTINANKPITGNARTTLAWNSGDGLCDETLTRGACRPLKDGPLSGRNADGRQQVFVVGADGQLWTNWQKTVNGLWNGWVNLGGNLQGSLSLGTSTDNRMELFALGADGSIQHNWQVSPNGAWNGWVSRGGSWPVGVQPTATRNADGRMEVFLVGADGALWHMWQVVPNGSWSGWLSNGGNWPPLSLPTIGLNGDSRLETYVVAADKALWHQWQVKSAPTGWSSWEPLGGSLAAPPTIGYSTDGRQELFAVGSGGAMQHLWQTSPNGGWSTWQSMGGTWTPDADLVAVRNADGRLEIFGRAADRAVVHSWQLTPNGLWSPFASLGGDAIHGPSLGQNADGRLELFIIVSGNELEHLWQDSSSQTGWSAWSSLGVPGV